MMMDDITAIGIAEGFVPNEGPKHELEAWQHLIDTGLCWRLQGWFGRTARHLIDIGACASRPMTTEAVSPWAIKND